VSHFGTNVYYSPLLLTALNKHFLTIGKQIVETTISLWQSSQTTKCEQAAKTTKPHHHEPYHLFQPSNPDLHPHTKSDVTAIALSASVLAPVIQKLVCAVKSGGLKLICILFTKSILKSMLNESTTRSLLFQNLSINLLKVYKQ